MNVASDISCDVCDREIIGSRHTCIVCTDKDISYTVDLCTSCVDKPASGDEFVHVNTHSLLKFDCPAADHDMAWTVPEAKTVVDRVKGQFRALASSVAPTTSSTPVHGPAQVKRARRSLLCACCGKAVTTPCWVCVSCSK